MEMKIKVLISGLALTEDKVYDAIRIASDIIEMRNDLGELLRYYYPSSYFENVTIKYNRNDIIDDILE